ncbi:MAG: ADP-ribosylglycohydrolase family protein [Planctomycetales bacterium]|nr:ADP-ribosylglycohydrolase family protein [Planctomycetales bacterium]MBN8628378.1 ADP-ribosylglycohydrolase family protein [Planctomycetota bacterium]
MNSAPNEKLLARFEGCLLGLAVGDALGGRFEAQSAEHLAARFHNVAALIHYPNDELWYTDDTQMMIGVAETLADYGEITEVALCRAFVANYVPTRGYGRGARAVIEAMEDGRDYRSVAEQYFPGGSFGNGAAMRVAPVGLLFCDRPERMRLQARLSSLPTHMHPLGIEGAVLIAAAVSCATRATKFASDAFFEELLDTCTTTEFRRRIESASTIRDKSELTSLGNGIDALNSVVTAIACFALTPHSYDETVGNAVLLGGDTDTIAAMAGAISGAYLGLEKIPARLLDLLEDGPKGRTYIKGLAGRLFDVYSRKSP